MKPQVFILSSPRSGSTVTRLTLDKLKDLTTLPETHFWVFKEANRKLKVPGDLPIIANRWVTYYSVSSFPIDHVELEKRIVKEAQTWNDVLEITISFYLKWKGIESVKWVCEKSPPHIFYLDKIARDYPQAKFIFLARDPRDVVASLKYCTWSTSNPYINAKVWRNGIRNFKNNRSDSLIIKYEDFVTNPQDVLREICQFLAIDYNADILQNGSEDEVEKKHYTSAQSLNKVNAGNIGSYKNKLSIVDREQEIIEFVCRKEMVKLGYPLEKYKGFNLPLGLRILVHRLYLLIQRIAR